MKSASNNRNNNPIGIYDSGIGGLTVFSELIKLLPNEKFIYYGDTANIPYGTKTKEELLKVTRKTMSFFTQHNVKAVVMACNTTSAVTYDILKGECDFILYPVTQSASEVIAKQGYKRIGVLSTEATAASHAYKTALLEHNPNIEVFEHGCPGEWVKAVENHTQNNPENLKVFAEHLNILLEKDPDRIILGCTHYPYLTNILTDIAGKNIFTDPAVCFAKKIASDLKEKDLTAKVSLGKPDFYVTSSPERFKESSEIFFPLRELPICV